MIYLCPLCDEPLKDGDLVIAEVETSYHHLKSKIAYAVDKNFTACHGVIHKDCYTAANKED